MYYQSDIICYNCKHHYIDMDNNYRCRLKQYPESNIIQENWGKLLMDAEKCDYFINLHKEK